MIDRLNIEGRFVGFEGVVELQLQRIRALILIDGLLDVGLQRGELLLRLLELCGRDELRRSAGRDDGGAVGGLDQHLQVRRLAVPETSCRVNE